MVSWWSDCLDFLAVSPLFVSHSGWSPAAGAARAESRAVILLISFSSSLTPFLAASPYRDPEAGVLGIPEL